MRTKMVRFTIAIILGVSGFLLIPSNLCRIGSSEWISSDFEKQDRYAREMSEMIKKNMNLSDFCTGDEVFNGEWLFGTYMMAGMGFAQYGVNYPEEQTWALSQTRICIEKMLEPKVRAFDCQMWKEDPIESLEGSNHHAAYLGYLNLVLSLYHSLSDLDEDDYLRKLNNQITKNLIKHIHNSPTMLLETYPGEVYPMDNCAVIASISLHGKATGEMPTDLVQTWIKMARKNCIDPDTGLLRQSIFFNNGKPQGIPRGSGTTLGLYFLSFADRELSHQLFLATKTELVDHWFGFGVVREYPKSLKGGGILIRAL